MISQVLTKKFDSCKLFKKYSLFSKNCVFEPLDLSDHHQNLYTCSECEYCIPTNFHRDRTTLDHFLGFSRSRGVTVPVVTVRLSHHCHTTVTPRDRENYKSDLEWSDHGENLSECSTHVLSKCTNFDDDPISLRVRKCRFAKISVFFIFLQEV